jgi:microcystin degradation protein MlrC
VCLYAPDEVGVCQQAGVGATVSFAVGGKVDRLHGDPVPVTGRVLLLHDGTYVEAEVRHGGKRVNHMGPTALLEAPGGKLVLTSLRHPPFSLGALTCLGLQPQQERILVVKAAIAYKAAYGPVAGSIIEVDTPGLTAINPVRLPYRHARLLMGGAEKPQSRSRLPTCRTSSDPPLVAAAPCGNKKSLPVDIPRGEGESGQGRPGHR